MTNNINTTASAADQLWVLTRTGLRIRGDQLVGIGFERAHFDSSDTPPYRVFGHVAYDPERTHDLARCADEAAANECVRKILELLARDHRGYGVLQIGRHTGAVSISRPKKPAPEKSVRGEVSSP
ncbi:hypothetical protein [Saccharopolyspora griseoalba]|uniref:Uncharacterized protein n=1 Tax=Saccharopolyspora griseoalba TaxID=1431848 RepID=A0ABW2LSZ1_9PSEU